MVHTLQYVAAMPTRRLNRMLYRARPAALHTTTSRHILSSKAARLSTDICSHIYQMYNDGPYSRSNGYQLGKRRVPVIRLSTGRFSRSPTPTVSYIENPLSSFEVIGSHSNHSNFPNQQTRITSSQ